MVLASLAAGVGTSALGGLMSGIGQSQRGGAIRGVAREGVRAGQQAGQELSASGDFASGRLADLTSGRQGALGARVQAFGPERTQARAQGMQDAQQLQTAAGGELGKLINRTPNIALQGAGLGTQLAARRLNAARALPRQEVQRARLADLFIQPQQQGAQIDYANTLAGLGRQAGEVSADDRLRRAQTLADLGLTQQQLGFDMQDAGSRGMFLQSLGNFTTGMAPGITAAMLPARPPMDTSAGGPGRLRENAGRYVGGQMALPAPGTNNYGYSTMFNR